MTKSFDELMTSVLSEMQTVQTPTGNVGGPQGNQSPQPAATQSSNAAKPQPSTPATHTDDDVINLVVKRLADPTFKKKMEDAIKQNPQSQTQQKPPQQQNAQQKPPQQQNAQQTPPQQQNQSKP